MYWPWGVLKNIYSEVTVQIIIKTSVAEFIFSKIPCSHYILLNTFSWIRLKYEIYPLRDTLFIFWLFCSFPVVSGSNAHFYFALLFFASNIVSPGNWAQWNKFFQACTNKISFFDSGRFFILKFWDCSTNILVS